MKYVNKRTVLGYLADQLTGNFMGFLIGFMASGLVSKFFETRGIKNLWGLASKKTVVDKETFSALEWIISLVVGFIVFEIFTKVIREWVSQHSREYKSLFFRWAIRNNVHTKLRNVPLHLNNKRIALFAAAHQGLSHVLNGRRNRGM